jgi:hypothetical protein
VIEFLRYVLLNPDVARIFYATCMALCGILCFVSHTLILRKIGLWLGVAWFGANSIFSWLGPAHAPWLIPSFEALVCVAIAHLAIRFHSHVAWRIVQLFVFEFGIVTICFLLRQQGSIAYYGALNVIFLGRLWVAGEAGYVELARRIHREPERSVYGSPSQ